MCGVSHTVYLLLWWPLSAEQIAQNPIGIVVLLAWCWKLYIYARNENERQIIQLTYNRKGRDIVAENIYQLTIIKLII